MPSYKEPLYGGYGADNRGKELNMEGEGSDGYRTGVLGREEDTYGPKPIADRHVKGEHPDWENLAHAPSDPSRFNGSPEIPRAWGHGYEERDPESRRAPMHGAQVEESEPRGGKQ